MSISRELEYSLAINEALKQSMEKDKDVLLIGQGVKSPWYVGKTTKDLVECFGEERVIDTPVSENAITGAAVGAALARMKSIVVHPRMDFMLYAFDPIINQAANWYYMNGGKLSVPVVFWGIINRKGEQAAQHSQALHSLFAHIPGLKVVMPSTPYDAKGLMIAAINDPNPVVFVDDRLLYNIKGSVPKETYEVKIGEGVIRKEGKDITIVSISNMANETLKASYELEKHGINCEVIDLRTAKPIDFSLVQKSVKKTGGLVVVDGGWRTCGWASEVSATVSEQMFEHLRFPVERITLKDCPAPASTSLEDNYYFDAEYISQRVKERVVKFK